MSNDGSMKYFSVPIDPQLIDKFKDACRKRGVLPAVATTGLMNFFIQENLSITIAGENVTIKLIED